MFKKGLMFLVHVQVYVNEIHCPEDAPMELEQNCQFGASVLQVFCHEQQLYSVEQGRLCVRTAQGTLKKTLSFREVEGEVTALDLNGRFLCLGSSKAFLRIYTIEEG